MQDLQEKPRDPPYDRLGIAADDLRQFFCGPNGYMFRVDVMATYAQIFAACDAVYGANAATLEGYKAWIHKVATGEFADEIILAACAQRLKICITTVPHKPTGSAPWPIAQHPIQENWQQHGITEENEIALGNNDVHYVWLSRELS